MPVSWTILIVLALSGLGYLATRSRAVRLAGGDTVVGALPVAEDDELVLLSDDAQLLRFPASSVRPQGRPAGGMAGIRLAPGARVVAFGVWAPGSPGVVVTWPRTRRR